MKSVENKNVVITGAASGIGKEMAILLAQKGANLAIIDIDHHKLQNVAEVLKKFRGKFLSYTCDISKREAIEATAKAIKNDFDAIDILINNAGIIVGKNIVDSTYEDYRKTIDVNLIGTMWMTNQFLREMIDRKSGHIVNVSSSAGFLAVPKMGDYCASKFGIIGFSDTLRLEMRKMGCTSVKVTIACPGAIDTGMFPGFKMPMLTLMMNKTVVAQKFIKGIEKEQSYIKIPFVVKLTPFIKCLPTLLLDVACSLVGINSAMDGFKKEF